MKTKKQLIEEIHTFINEIHHPYLIIDLEGIINIVVEACEEAIKESPEWAFENLKKLKSR